MRYSTPVLYVSTRLWMTGTALRRRVSTLLAGTLTTAMLPAAHADDDLFGMFNHVAEGADSSDDSWMKLAKFGGIGCCLIGLVLLIAKKKNPQISWGAILTFWGVGFVGIALDQFIKKGQSTIELNPVDVG